MPFDPHSNLASSLVTIPPSPEASGTTLTVAAGQGALFPNPSPTPFNCTVSPFNTFPTQANSEIVRVTAIVGDTFTIMRAQEGTTAKPIAAGWLIANSITAKTLTDIEAATGGGGSGVSSVSGLAPVVSSGGTTPEISMPVATSSDDGYLSATDWSTFNGKQSSGNYITALTGDVAASGPGSAAATLATVNSDVGSFGSATEAVALTVNAKGLVTTATETTITPAVGSITGLGTGVATALGVNVGTGGAVVVNGGALGTPSSGVATNLTGTAAGLTAGNVTTNANLTGDVTSVGNATTLATVNSNVGSFGSSTAIPVITLNAKGLATAASTAAVVAPAGTLSGATLASGVVNASLNSISPSGGTLATAGILSHVGPNGTVSSAPSMSADTSVKVQNNGSLSLSILTAAGGLGYIQFYAGGDTVAFSYVGGNATDDAVDVAVGSGASSPTVITRTTASGLAVFGTVSPGSYVVTNLPSASGRPGAMAYVTDANATTRLSAVAGGGSNKVMVFSDGTNWLIL